MSSNIERRKVRRLYVLQGTEYGIPGTVPEGTPLAEFKMHYADGSEASMPVAFGLDLRDWFDNDQGMPVTRGMVVWTGSNSRAVAVNSSLRLYLGVWENPHPEKLVADLDFVKSEDTICAPFCLAITAEE